MRHRVCSLVVIGILAMGPAAHASFIGDPGLIAYIESEGSSYSGALRVVSLTGEPRTLATGNVASPSWAPDGGKLLVANDEGLALVDSNGTLLRMVVGNRTRGDRSIEVVEGTWFPDGRRIAYVEKVSTDNGISSVYLEARLVVANQWGTTLRRFDLDTQYQYRLPTVSPDGRWIALSRAPVTNPSPVELLSVRINTRRVRVLTPPATSQWTVDDVSGRFAANGSIVFIRRQGRCSYWPGYAQHACAFAVMQVRPDGTRQEVLVDGIQDVDQDGRTDAPTYVVRSPNLRYLALQIHEFHGYCFFGCAPQYAYLYAYDLERGEWARVGSNPPSNTQAPPPDSSEQNAAPVFDMDWQPDCTIYGTRGDDRLTGTDNDDLICALGGDDIIRGLGGDDSIFGHGGDDRITGGAGADIVVGNSGRDRCDRDESDYFRVC